MLKTLYNLKHQIHGGKNSINCFGKLNLFQIFDTLETHLVIYHFQYWFIQRVSHLFVYLVIKIEHYGAPLGI